MYLTHHTPAVVNLATNTGPHSLQGKLSPCSTYLQHRR